jgi:DNA replication protein DnaC
MTIDNSKYLQILESAGIPALHRRIKTTDLDRNSLWFAQYSRLEARLGSGLLCAILGRKGTGKTQMAVQLCRATAMQYRPVKFSSPMDFFLTIKAGFKPGGKSEQEIIADFCAPRLLILDEVEERGETAWEDRLLKYLINRRYEAQKDTVLISNLSPEEFEMHLDDKIISRMAETGGVIACDWPSFRTAKQEDK